MNRSLIFVVVIALVSLTLLLGGCGGGSSGGGDSTKQMGGARQGVTMTLSGETAILAGISVVGSQDGTGSAARFYRPYGITSDGTNLYVADSYNHTIRRIVIATGEVTTLAGSAGAIGSIDGTGSAARFNFPEGIATDGTNLYVADTSNQTIRRIVIATGAVTTLAGSAGASGSIDGTGSAARFNVPVGITADGTNLYVADSFNNTIRKVVIATGEVTTLAGSAGASGSIDGTSSAARFNFPKGITTDGTNLYVADMSNQTVRKIVITSGEVTTLAGSAGAAGSTDGTGSAARLSYPYGITTDGTSLYVVEPSTIRQIVIASGEVTTLAGSAGARGTTDGTGSAARFYSPYGITNDGANLYVADDAAIRKVVIASGEVTTLAGSRWATGTTDGTGSAARFSGPYGITTDGTNLYVADNFTIRKVVLATAEVTTIAGAAGATGTADGTGSAARFFSPHGITTDGTGIYVADYLKNTIRKVVIATGEVTTLAGSAGATGTADGTGSAARFYRPNGITTDGTNLYVADSSNHTIRKVVIATGEVTTLAGSAGVTGSDDGTGTEARLTYPYDVTTDGINLYVADSYNNTVRKIVIATGEVTTLAGSAGATGSIDGTGSAARFYRPNGITTDGTNLYVADRSNYTIRKIVIATGEVTTLAGSAGVAGSTDGTGSSARFYVPNGITTDGTRLYVAEGNNIIRTIR
ncbi:hypothetical protein KI809_01425 [Geobacter pelophilus]|uniref:NHL repeat-containing protein n=1 Tax=Geoanaerobacter pelophilus TaxID=60036 RepID=A0AAW4L0D4_9BACT|nr:hypothetical protein [Geoanaerobacter pelophilus]MBT0662945.1 hypothetical protein [Geoanaerobacter pelophilus]